MKSFISGIGLLLCSYIGHCQMSDSTKNQISNAFLHQGVMEADKGNWMKAIAHYNDAIEFYPKNSIAYYNRAVAKYNLNDYRGAIFDYFDAIKHNEQVSSTNADSYYGLGLCFYFLGDKTRACWCFSNGGELGKAECYVIIKKYCN